MKAYLIVMFVLLSINCLTQFFNQPEDLDTTGGFVLFLLGLWLVFWTGLLLFGG